LAKRATIGLSESAESISKVTGIAGIQAIDQCEELDRFFPWLIVFRKHRESGTILSLMPVVAYLQAIVIPARRWLNIAKSAEISLDYEI
jgi:hypothetical protein